MQETDIYAIIEIRRRRCMIEIDDENRCELRKPFGVACATIANCKLIRVLEYLDVRYDRVATSRRTYFLLTKYVTLLESYLCFPKVVAIHLSTMGLLIRSGIRSVSIYLVVRFCVI